MAIAKKSYDVLLFVGVMYCSLPDLKNAKDKLISHFGEISSELLDIDFSKLTSYYNNEMGENIKKAYLVFNKRVSPESLAQIKITTNIWEEEFSSDGKRSLNFDPGYLTKEKFILASAKDFAHRIYIGDGIYGEVTLHFKGNKSQFFSWTYDDYLDKNVEKFLLNSRKVLYNKKTK